MDPHYALALTFAPGIIKATPSYAGKSNTWDPGNLSSGPHPTAGHLAASSEAVHLPGAQFLHLHIKVVIDDGFPGP